MNCKEVQAVMIEYLDQSLDQATTASVKRHLDDCAACRQEAQEIQQLLLAVKDSPMEKPGPALRENFNTLLQSELNMVTMTSLLEEEPAMGKTGALSDNRNRGIGETGREGQHRIGRIAWRAAAAVVLLIGGAWIGATYQAKRDAKPDQMASLQKEVREMKEVLLFSLIDDESASQRIKAVSYAEEMANPDQLVIDALMNTLNNDKNANVRLAALYSLARWADNRTVRDSLVLSLDKQKEPIVQIVLINLLAEKRETRAIAPIKAILSNGKVMKEVKDAAQKGLKVL